MDTLERIIKDVWEGCVVNVVGLPGTGRTEMLRAIGDRLTADGFVSHYFDASDLVAEDQRTIIEQLRAFCRQGEYRVFLIDNCDAVFSSFQRDSLDQILSGIVLTDEIDPHRESRLVFTSTPRDRDLVGPSPNVREQRYTPYSVPLVPHSLKHQEEIFAGGYPPLLNGVDLSAMDARDHIRRRAYAQAPLLIGCLRPEQHRRISRVARSLTGSQWRDGIDDFLYPLVCFSDPERRKIARITPCFENIISSLLSSEPWPSLSIQDSARRLRSRCGLVNIALWVDPYLTGFRSMPNLHHLRAFFDAFFEYASAPRELRILSRKNPDRGTSVNPLTMATDLRAAFRGRPWLPRLSWRLFTSRHGNLHDRHLILPERAEAFFLPPADRVLGQRPVVNEADGEVTSEIISRTERTWTAAECVL